MKRSLIVFVVLCCVGLQSAAAENVLRYERAFVGDEATIHAAVKRGLVAAKYRLIAADDAAFTASFQTNTWTTHGSAQGNLELRSLKAQPASCSVVLTMWSTTKFRAAFPSIFEDLANHIFKAIQSELAVPTVTADTIAKNLSKNAGRKNRQAGGVVPPAPGAPPTLEIASTAGRVKALLVSHYARNSFAVATDSTYQLAFWRDVAAKPDFFGLLLVGNYTPNFYRLYVNFVVVEKPTNAVEVTATAEISVQDYAGRVTRYLVTQDPGVHRELSTLLSQVKLEVETNDAAASR